MITRSNIFSALLVTTSMLSFLSIGLIIWAKYFEEPYLSFHNLPFPALEKGYAGEVIPLSVERCSTSGKIKNYTITHNIRNEVTGISEMMPAVGLSVEPGCHKTVSKLNIVPTKTKPGLYTIWGSAVIEMRVGRREIPWRSEMFEVLPPKVLPTVAGPAGPAGATGATGAKGATGASGAKGATGDKGTFWGGK